MATAPKPSSELYGSNLISYIIGEAKALKLDPAAVLSVVTHEGGFSGAVGDQGTSFGPFQLHKGDALPAWVWAKGPIFANAWAWSPAGIDYALQGIAKSGAAMPHKSSSAAMKNFMRVSPFIGMTLQ